MKQADKKIRMTQGYDDVNYSLNRKLPAGFGILKSAFVRNILPLIFNGGQKRLWATILVPCCSKCFQNRPCSLVMFGLMAPHSLQYVHREYT
jgi:hypothetical protein